MKILPSISLNRDIIRIVKKEILKYYYKNLFYNIKLYVFDNENIFNDNDILKNALLTNKIQYIDGFFYGDFNSSISKELRKLGADFNNLKKAFKLESFKIPADLFDAILENKSITQNKFSKFQSILNRFSENENIINVDKIIYSYLSTIDKKIVNNIKNVSIAPKLSEQNKIDIANEYTNNINLYIKNFDKNLTLKLRKELTELILNKNYNYKSLSKIIQKGYNITNNKADFLARQETSLLLSKFETSRYSESGLYYYIWDTSKDERLRKDHKLLEGYIFDTRNPPIVDQKTRKKANPGEDYNCRCKKRYINILDSEYTAIYLKQLKEHPYFYF